MLGPAQRPVRLLDVGKAAGRMPLPPNKGKPPRSSSNRPSQTRVPPALRDAGTPSNEVGVGVIPVLPQAEGTYLWFFTDFRERPSS
jgi:hypothetical protein